MSDYRLLADRMREIGLVSSAGAVLSWDQETYMPARALNFRAEQLSFLSGWTHRQFTDPAVGKWIESCEGAGLAADSVEAANVREWRRRYDRQVRVPAELVEEMERVSVVARDAWVGAREASDFSKFKPHLETIVALNRKLADCWGYEASPYDALLDEYEPGMTAGMLRPLFSDLKPEIVSLLGPAAERSRQIPEDFLAGDYPVASQQAFNREVATAFGFDFEGGRVDTTTHPFCTGLGPGDCRITTRYSSADFSQSLYGVLHEVGHGLYEQGLLPEHFGSPAGNSVSLGIHESQSRLWENHVGRTLAFWEHWHPAACRHFPNLKPYTPEQIWRALNRVTPSLIRVEADQVTYDLHIILRFEIEVKLIEGTLKAADVPAYWNEAFESMLGIPVPNDREGCLQDIHWSMGGLGYFPTYTLGNLNAAQLFARALRDHASLESELVQGRYGTLLGWLREKVHNPGSRYTPNELMERATGETTQTRYHVDHLKALVG